MALVAAKALAAPARVTARATVAPKAAARAAAEPVVASIRLAVARAAARAARAGGVPAAPRAGAVTHPEHPMTMAARVAAEAVAPRAGARALPRAAVLLRLSAPWPRLPVLPVLPRRRRRATMPLHACNASRRRRSQQVFEGPRLPACCGTRRRARSYLQRARGVAAPLLTRQVPRAMQAARAAEELPRAPSPPPPQVRVRMRAPEPGTAPKTAPGAPPLAPTTAPPLTMQHR